MDYSNIIRFEFLDPFSLEDTFFKFDLSPIITCPHYALLFATDVLLIDSSK